MDIIEQKAIKAAISGDWELAVKLNLELISNGKVTVAVCNRLGKAYSELSNWSKAVEFFEKSLILDPVNSVAQKGVNSAKLNKKAGVSTRNPGETVLRDMNTVKIIETSSLKLELNHDYEMVMSDNSSFYFLINISSGKKLRRISRKNLALKSGANPQKLKAKVIEIRDELAWLKITAQEPVFTSEKAQTDPSIEVDLNQLEEDKKHFTKLYELEQEIEE